MSHLSQMNELHCYHEILMMRMLVTSLLMSFNLVASIPVSFVDKKTPSNAMSNPSAALDDLAEKVWISV